MKAHIPFNLSKNFQEVQINIKNSQGFDNKLILKVSENKQLLKF